MKTIIAFCGLAGSGKDTACNYLVDRHKFKKASFAGPMKEMAKIAFDFTDEQLYGSSSNREQPDERYPFSGMCVSCGVPCTDYTQKPEYENDLPEGFWFHCESCGTNYPKFITARLALQTLGTEWGRRLHTDIWAKAAINQIMASDHERWCISDLRFLNEMHAVHAVKFRSDRPARGLVVRLLRGELRSTHASETELMTIDLRAFDRVVDNFGELYELYEKLDIVVSRAMEAP